MTNEQELKGKNTADFAEALRMFGRCCNCPMEFECDTLDCVKSLIIWLRRVAKADKKIELLPCPFCGNDEIEKGAIDNPLAWWDSNIRGERCGYVRCYNCNATIKAETVDEAVELWNTRERMTVK